MPIPNEELIRKAQAQISDLAAGGLGNPTQATKFMVDVVQSATLLKMARTVMMPESVYKIPKLTITGRVMHAAAEAEALTFAQRTAPTPSEVEITTKEMVGEIPLNDSYLEDNIEKKTLWATIRTLMQKKAALDIQQNVVEGDTASADPDLALFDGIIKLSTSNTYTGGSAAWSIDLAEQGMRTMPERYMEEDEANLRWLCAARTERKYRKGNSARATALGDLLLENKKKSSPLGVDMVPIAQWPVTLGVGGNETVLMLLNPKNIAVGIHRRMTQEFERSARARITTLVFTIRVGVEFEEEQAVVQAYQVLAA